MLLNFYRIYYYRISLTMGTPHTFDFLGEITTTDLITTMPFENTVQRLTLKGRVLMEVLEHSVRQYSIEERKGGFLQFSGQPSLAKQLEYEGYCFEICKVSHFISNARTHRVSQ